MSACGRADTFLLCSVLHLSPCCLSAMLIIETCNQGKCAAYAHYSMPMAKTYFSCFGAGKVCLTVKNTGYQLVPRLRVVAPNAAQQAVNEPADVLLGRVYPRNDLHHISSILLTDRAQCSESPPQVLSSAWYLCVRHAM